MFGPEQLSASSVSAQGIRAITWACSQKSVYSHDRIGTTRNTAPIPASDTGSFAHSMGASFGVDQCHVSRRPGAKDASTYGSSDDL